MLPSSGFRPGRARLGFVKEEEEEEEEEEENETETEKIK